MYTTGYKEDVMLAANYRAQTYSLATRLPILCGAVDPLLFTLADLIEVATRPGYSPWHNFVSSLSLGDQGWMQIASFLVCGGLTLCFSVGLRQVFSTGKSSIGGLVMLGITEHAGRSR